MNILINTPLLKSATLKEEFDNKVLFVFLMIITFLVILGLFFIDLIKSSNRFPLEDNDPLNSLKISGNV